MKLIAIVFDYLGAYNKDLDKELNMLFEPKVARVTIDRMFPEVGYCTEL